jgi:hypothetical protein
MDLATLDLSPDEIEQRLAVYEAQLATERTVEDDAVRRAYRVARRGLPIINLPNTIAAGGWFPNGLPRLAVVRADQFWCHVRTETWGAPHGHTTIAYADTEDRRGRAAVGRHRVQVTVPTPRSITNRAWRGRTVVPTIPPNLRPRARRLHLFHLLWEVEAWQDVPPTDPALLRHLGGNLWAVHAVWDLTEIERAVLADGLASR